MPGSAVDITVWLDSRHLVDRVRCGAWPGAPWLAERREVTNNLGVEAFGGGRAVRSQGPHVVGAVAVRFAKPFASLSPTRAAARF